MARADQGVFVVMDVIRFRGGPEQVEAAIVQTAIRDGTAVAVSLPQDPGQAGKSQVQHFTRLLAGFRVQCTPETGSKMTRAGPFAAQCNVGNVAILPGLWNAAFLAELSGFPDAGKDDQVDAASRAFLFLTSMPEPGRAIRVPLLHR